MPIKFLSVTVVFRLHDEQILLYGGLNGIRDINLLESAVLAPQSTFNGNYLYSDHFQMASAYAFGLIKNHPFLDGNKRTGIAASLLFLRVNDFKLSFKSGELYILAIEIASNQLSQAELAHLFKEKSY